MSLLSSTPGGRLPLFSWLCRNQRKRLLRAFHHLVVDQTGALNSVVSD